MVKVTRPALPAAVAALAAASLLAPTPPAQSFETWSNRVLIGGVTNKQYWMAAGVEANYFDATNQGVGRWNQAPSVPVSFSRTMNKPASEMDFYRTADDNPRRDYCAITWHIVGTTDVNTEPNGAPSRNWEFGRVYINQHTFKTPLCGNASRRAPIIAHEMGHVMGLAHAGGTTLMARTISSPTSPATAPTQDDRNGINALY
ncbi:matrixin family metalloprotease [Pimelobacter simplex]|uniref:matrixin family metalloprotease n=1 Tax=Nocardioides simplex TaxID=2045 RepID=UPI00130DDC5B|nr:matrixin family metalloprotease [Pimelobacter simplex]MCG8153206.1 matrixin family metalloprotease [Pimelobacter simplex]